MALPGPLVGLVAVNEGSASSPATSVSASLSAGQAQWAFVLLIEGYNLGLTTTDDVSGMASAWSSASQWTNIKGGLDLIGALESSAYPFDSEIQTPGMSFTFVDSGSDFTSVALREANSSATASRLYSSMDSDDILLTMMDSSAFPSSGTVYVGTEEITYTANGGGGTLLGLTRGVRSLFGTESSGYFGQPHTIDNDTGFRPLVSTHPRVWVGRQVGLYLCRKVDGTWSAGLPGSNTNDSECIFAGTIRGITDGGDGRIRLECSSILEKLRGSLLNNQYKGYLQEGVYMPTSGGHLGVKITKWNGGANTVSYQTANIFGTPGVYSHQQVAELIRAQLSTWFVTSPGTSFPNTQHLNLSLTADSNGPRYSFGFYDTGAGDVWQLEIQLDPGIIYFLGYNSDQWSNGGRDANGYYYGSLTKTSGSDMSITAKRSPTRFNPSILQVGSTFTVTQVLGGSYTSQPTIPPYFTSDTTGFIRVAGKHVLAVKSTGTNAFSITGYLPPQFATLGITAVDASTGAPDYTDLGVKVSEGSGDDGVLVEQVWFETGRTGDLLLRWMASTGTGGYNHLAYYDWHPRQMGLGLPWRMIDNESVLQLGTEPYLAFFDKPTPFIAILESALQLRNWHGIWKRGKFTLVSFGESSAATTALTESNKASQVKQGDAVGSRPDRSSVTRTLDHIKNRINIKYQLPFGSGAQPKTIAVNNSESQTDFGVRPVTIEAKGVYDSIGGGTIDGLASRVAATILAYFGRPLGLIERSYNLSLLASIYPGARVTVTDNGIINPVSGSRGVTSLLAWVVSCSFDFTTGVGRAVLLFSPEKGSSHFGIMPPSARVDPVSTGSYQWGYDTSTKKLLCKPHEYSGPIATVDVGSFAVGDKVHIVELSCASPASPTEFNDTIASVDTTANTLTLTTGLGSGSAVSATSLAAGSFDTVRSVTDGWTSGSTNITANRLYVFCLETWPATGVAGDLGREGSLTFVHPTDPTQNITLQMAGGASSTWDTGIRRKTVWYGMPSANITGGNWVLSAISGPDVGDTNNNIYSIVEVTGVTTGANGSYAVAQYKQASMTNASGAADAVFITFDNAFGSANNGSVAFWSNQDRSSGVSVAPGTGWTELDDRVDLACLQTEWRATSDTTPSLTAPVSLWHGAALELVAAGPLVGKEFVVEFDDILQVVSTQRDNECYLASETTHSTGLAANDEYFYASERDGLAIQQEASRIVEWTNKYKRLANSADDTGEPLSVHKLHETQDWLNQALSYHTANVLAQYLPTTSSELLENTDTANYQLLYGPIWVPLYGMERALKVQAYGHSNTAGAQATLKVITSSGLVRGVDTSFKSTTSAPLSWPDGGTKYVSISLPASTSYSYTDIATIDPPAVYPSDTPGCWLTVLGLAASGGSCRVKGLWVWESFLE